MAIFFCRRCSHHPHRRRHFRCTQQYIILSSTYYYWMYKEKLIGISLNIFVPRREDERWTATNGNGVVGVYAWCDVPYMLHFIHLKNDGRKNENVSFYFCFASWMLQKKRRRMKLWNAKILFLARAKPNCGNIF